MSTPKILGISGSLRAQATNRKLLREAARLFGDCAYSEADINFPLYDGDDEENTGIPPAVTNLNNQIGAADAVIISTPEYNKGPSGALKNALDWVSRVEGNPWHDKPVAVISAAAGRAGGEEQVGLPAEEGRDLQHIDGGGKKLTRLQRFNERGRID